MKIVKKNVYYCEFCKKKGLSAGHMNAHENSCTGNLKRECRMCIDEQPDYPVLIGKYKSQMKMRTEVTEEQYVGKYITHTIEQKPSLDDIAEDCGGCPACVLTVLRACDLCGHEWEMGFDFKAWNQEWWTERRFAGAEY